MFNEKYRCAGLLSLYLHNFLQQLRMSRNYNGLLFYKHTDKEVLVRDPPAASPRPGGDSNTTRLLRFESSPLRRPGRSSLLTLRWREPDSNSRSHPDGTAVGGRPTGQCRRGPYLKWLRLSCRCPDWQRPAEPFAAAGPMVRIRFPPAVSPRTLGPSRDGTPSPGSSIWPPSSFRIILAHRCLRGDLRDPSARVGLPPQFRCE